MTSCKSIAVIALFLIVGPGGLTRAIFAEGRTVKLEILSTGTFEANYSDLVAGGASRQVTLPIPVYLIRHPSNGMILFDSGLGLKFKSQLQGWWLHRLFQLFLPYHLGAGETASEQMVAQGIQAKDVRYIILSHLHYDHAGGLADFPKAQILVSEDEWQHGDVSRLRARFYGYMKEMYEGMEDRVQLIEYPPVSNYDPFEASLDLFGDGSLMLLATPGHTPGHQSLLLPSVFPCPRIDKAHDAGPDRPCPVLLTGDAVWVRENYERPAPKGWKAQFIEESKEQAWETTQKIHQFHQEHPEVVIISGHDPERLQGKN